MRFRLVPRPAAALRAALGLLVSLLLAVALLPALAGPARAAAVVVTGKVTGPNASGVTVPIEDVFVEAANANGNPLEPRVYAYTAADGTYSLSVPAAGSFRIQMECWGDYACADEYAPEPDIARTISGPTVIDATLERWGRITGTVRKNGMATAWPNGAITARNDQRSYWSSDPAVAVQPNGSFEIDKVAPGAVTVTGSEAYDAENVLSTIDGQIFTVNPGATSAIDLAVEDWPGLYVRAVDGAGVPLEQIGWQVYSRPVGGAWDDGLQMGPLLTDVAGRMSYRIADKSREYTVCFLPPAGTPTREKRCLGGTTGLAGATVWKHSAAQPKLKGDIALPYSFTASPTPTVTGAAKVGSTLTAVAGAWSPSATLSYQWLRAGSPISGATGTTYVAGADDLDKALSVRVTGSKTGYEATMKTSAATAAVVQGTFTTIATPTITGSAKVGSTLTAHAGTWVPAATSSTYQWFRAGVAIPGATGSSRVLTADDAGATLSVRVTGTKLGYEAASVMSAPSEEVAEAAFASVPTPTVTGTATVGSTLTADAGTWVPAATTTTYQWLRSGVAIPGAVAATYQVTAADAGHGLAVRVTATLSGYAPVAMASAPTAPVALAAFAVAPAPKIKGKAKVRSKLKAVVGTWSPTPATTTFQWYRNGKPIKGAVAHTYKVRNADRRKRITVVVTQALPGHVTVSLKSAATRKIR